MKRFAIILALIVIIIAVASFYNSTVVWIITVVAWIVLSLLSPFIQLFLGPAIATVKLFSIVSPSLYTALIIAVLSAFILKKRTSSKWILTASSFLIFWLVHAPCSIYLGERHIHLMAQNKYSTEAHDVDINLGGWYKVFQGNHMGLPGHDRYLGKPHGYIYLDGKKCNWSFTKNDFVCSRRRA